MIGTRETGASSLGASNGGNKVRWYRRARRVD